MPWQGVSPVDLRVAFATDFASGLYSMTELCEQYEISRKTGYYWIDRFEAEGRAGLSDRSRRPHVSPRATPSGVVEQLCEARRRHPTWSGRKLIAVLRRQQPTIAWPSRSTASELLKRHGLVRVRRRHMRRHAPAAPLSDMSAPNAVWTTDFKGEFRTGDGRYCYPLTLRDGYSRFVLRCHALPSTRSDLTRAQFARAFAEYGLPDRIRSDNGFPFAGHGHTRLSALSVWWIRLGILPERIALGHPEQNGSHEQFHRVLKRDTTRPPAPNASAQQQRFRRFCAEYNYERPHEALGDDVPATHYRPSRRRLPRRLPPLEYPGHLEIRRVSSCGTIGFRHHVVYLTTVLAGEDVALEEIAEGIWIVQFGGVRLVRIDERTHAVTAISYRS
jgi:transposase InsO family protein